uniref:Uncharacterized protein n=1 Tax=Anguilla anguilla TaxID=7936 RepID=A0A0E9XT07_ANGAN
MNYYQEMIPDARVADSHTLGSSVVRVLSIPVQRSPRTFELFSS